MIALLVLLAMIVFVSAAAPDPFVPMPALFVTRPPTLIKLEFSDIANRVPIAFFADGSYVTCHLYKDNKIGHDTQSQIKTVGKWSFDRKRRQVSLDGQQCWQLDKEFDLTTSHLATYLAFTPLRPGRLSRFISHPIPIPVDNMDWFRVDQFVPNTLQLSPLCKDPKRYSLAHALQAFIDAMQQSPSYAQKKCYRQKSFP